MATRPYFSREFIDNRRNLPPEHQPTKPKEKSTDRFKKLSGRLKHHWNRWKSGEAAKKSEVSFKTLGGEEDNYLRVRIHLPPEYLNDHAMGIVAEHGDTVGFYLQNYGRFLALLRRMGAGTDLTRDNTALEQLLQEADEESREMQATHPVPENIQEISAADSLGAQAIENDETGKKYQFKRANARKDNALAFNQEQEYTYEEALRHVQLNGINIEFLDWSIAQIMPKLGLQENLATLRKNYLDDTDANKEDFLDWVAYKINSEEDREKLKTLLRMSILFKEFRVPKEALLTTDNIQLPERQYADEFWEAAKLMEHTHVLEVLDYLGKLGIKVPIDEFLDLQGLNEKKVYTIASRQLNGDNSQDIEINFSVSAKYKPGAYSFGDGKFAMPEDKGHYMGTTSGLFKHLKDNSQDNNIALFSCIEGRFSGGPGKPLANEETGHRDPLTEEDIYRMETETPLICTMGTGTAALEAYMQYLENLLDEAAEEGITFKPKPAIVVLGVRDKDKFFIAKDKLRGWRGKGLIKEVRYVESRNKNGTRKEPGERYLQGYFNKIYAEELDKLKPGEKLTSMVCGDSSMGMGIWYGLEEFYGYDEEIDLMEQMGGMLMSASGGGLYKEEAMYKQKEILEELGLYPIDLKRHSIAENIKHIDTEKEQLFTAFKEQSGDKIQLQIAVEKKLSPEEAEQSGAGKQTKTSEYEIALFPEEGGQNFRVSITQGNTFEFFADLAILTRNAKKPQLGQPKFKNGSTYISADTLLFLSNLKDKSGEKEPGDWEVEGAHKPWKQTLKKLVKLRLKRAFILDDKRHNQTSFFENVRGTQDIPESASGTEKLRIKAENKQARLKAMEQAKKLSNIPGLRYSEKKKRWCYFDQDYDCWLYADHNIVRDQLQEKEFHIEKTRELFDAMRYYVFEDVFRNGLRATEFRRFGGKPRKGESMFVDGFDDANGGQSQTNGNKEESAQEKQEINYFITYAALAYYVLIDGLKGALDEISELKQGIRDKRIEIAIIQEDLKTIQEDLKRIGEMKGAASAKAEWNRREVEARLKKQLERLEDELPEEQQELIFKRLEAVAISGMAGGVVGHSLAEVPLLFGLKAGNISNWLEFSGTTIAAGGQVAMTIVALREAMMDSLEFLGFREKIELAKSSLNKNGKNKIDLGFTLDPEHQKYYIKFLRGQMKLHGTTAVLNAATSTSQFLMQLAYVISVIETGGSTAGFNPKLLESALVISTRVAGAGGTVSAVFTKSILEAAYFSSVFPDSDEAQAERFLEILQKGQLSNQAKVNWAKDVAENETIPQFLYTSIYNYIETEVSHIEETSLFKSAKREIVNAFEPNAKDRKAAKTLLAQHLKGELDDLDTLVDLAYKNFAASLKSGMPTPRGGKYSFYNKNGFSQPIFDQLENREQEYKDWFRKLLLDFYKGPEKDKRIDAFWEAKKHANFRDSIRIENRIAAELKKIEENSDDAPENPKLSHAQKLLATFNVVGDEAFQESFLTKLLKGTSGKTKASINKYLTKVTIQKDSQLRIPWLVLVPLYLSVKLLALVGAVVVGVLTFPALLVSSVGWLFGVDKTRDSYKRVFQVALSPALLAAGGTGIALGVVIGTMAVPALIVGGMLYGTNALIKTVAPKAHKKMVKICYDISASVERQWVNLSTLTKNKLPRLHHTIAYPYRWITTLNIPFPWVRQRREGHEKEHWLFGNKHIGWESDKTLSHFDFKAFFDALIKASREGDEDKLRELEYPVKVMKDLWKREMQEVAKDNEGATLQLLYEVPNMLMDQTPREEKTNQNLGKKLEKATQYLSSDTTQTESITPSQTSRSKPLFRADSSIIYTNQEVDSERTPWNLWEKLRETTQYLKNHIHTIPEDRNKEEESDKKLREEAEKAFKRLYGNLYDEHYKTLDKKEKKEEMALHKEVQLKWLMADILELKEGKSARWQHKEAAATDYEKTLGVKQSKERRRSFQI